MKNSFTIFVLFISALVYSQNSSAPDMNKMVVDYLTKSRNIGDLNRLIDILDGELSMYSAYLNYVPSINPLNPKNQKRISSKFGNRFHPIDSKVKPHYGIDISAPAGTPIHAAASGVVNKTVRSSTGYGNQVIIKHDFGFKTRYAHMYVFVVKEGFEVKKGDIIGFVGSTGKSTGNHIHFEIIKNNNRIDPYPFFSLNLEY